MAASIAHVRTGRVKLSDLSIGEDSGWRGLNVRRVDELLHTLKAGDFGKTTLAKPSVLCDQSDQVAPAPSKVVILPKRWSGIYIFDLFVCPGCKGWAWCTYQGPGRGVMNMGLGARGWALVMG